MGTLGGVVARVGTIDRSVEQTGDWGKLRNVGRGVRGKGKGAETAEGIGEFKLLVMIGGRTADALNAELCEEQPLAMGLRIGATLS